MLKPSHHAPAKAPVKHKGPTPEQVAANNAENARIAETKRLTAIKAAGPQPPVESQRIDYTWRQPVTLQRTVKAGDAGFMDNGRDQALVKFPDGSTKVVLWDDLS
jgi:hypothetical protein